MWMVAVVGGPILLAAVLFWAMTHNRLSRRAREDRDAATRRVREDSEGPRRRSVRADD
jgi:hypothetical protein